MRVVIWTLTLVVCLFGFCLLGLVLVLAGGLIVAAAIPLAILVASGKSAQPVITEMVADFTNRAVNH